MISWKWGLSPFLAVRNSRSCVIALVCACGLLVPGETHADSGLRQGSFGIVSGTANPPPDETVTSTWSFDISNINDVCDEGVLVTKKGGILNDPANQDLPLLQRSGKSKFEGFKLSPGGDLSPLVTTELEDESCPGCARPPLRVYFDITTGEDLQGCDFKGAEQKLSIRDVGLFCFTCCDGADELPAEPPTEFNPVLRINAATTSNGAGTGTIYGWVSRSIASQIIGQVTEVKARKVGTCVSDAPDNLDTYDEHMDSVGGTPLKLPTSRGCYAFENIPFGSYTVRARADGAFFVERSITVAGSTPIETNICGGASCPSNPACVP